MLGGIDQLARAHGRRLRLVALPVAAAATVLTVVGKGLGWLIGGITILAAVTIWTYVLYFMADWRCEQMKTGDTTSGLSGLNAAQLHQQVCETTEYWDHLHDLLAEVANTSIPDVLAEPLELPATPMELGCGFMETEKMMKDLLDDILPSKSRYVAYYIFGDNILASTEVNNWRKRRPPDLQLEPRKQELLLTMVELGEWIVLPDVGNPAPRDRKYAPLCFDGARFRSFAFLPLRVDGPVDNLNQQFGLAVGALLIEAPSVNGLPENFCGTAMQAAADILALGFASARSRFAGEAVNAKP